MGSCAPHRSNRHQGNTAQWAWAPDSPRKGNGALRVLLMVREAVLLNSLKRLMVAAPIYESTINKWSGGHAAPPPGPPQSDVASEMSGYEDIAPHVGAQFAQVSWHTVVSLCMSLLCMCRSVTGVLLIAQQCNQLVAGLSVGHAGGNVGPAAVCQIPLVARCPTCANSIMCACKVL